MMPTVIPTNVLAVLASLVLILGCQPPEEAASPIEMPQVELPPAASPGPEMSVASFEIPVDEPSATQTVKLGMATDRRSVKPGESFTLGIRLRIASGWHVYAVNQPTGVNIPTTLKLTLPAGMQQVGEWEIPKPYRLNDTTFAYEKEVVFRQLIAIPSDGAAGDQEVVCEVGYQSCSETSCLRPTKATLQVPIRVAE